MPTSRKNQCKRSQGCLYMAMELGDRKWKLAFSTGRGQKARRRDLRARSGGALLDEIKLAKKRLGLDAGARVVSCYEAGRDGFWLHRWLWHRGIENIVVDSSSIQVSLGFLRYCRAKKSGGSRRREG